MGPAVELTILGLLVHLSALAVEVRPDPRMLPAWIKSVEVALYTCRLTPSEARQMAGWLLFACSTLCGRTGVAHLRRLFNQATRPKSTLLRGEP